MESKTWAAYSRHISTSTENENYSPFYELGDRAPDHRISTVRRHHRAQKVSRFKAGRRRSFITSKAQSLLDLHVCYIPKMKWLVHFVAPLISVVIFILLPPVKNAINTTLMGVFRDLGRIKARKRRLANSGAVVGYNPNITNWDILFRRDDPLEDIDFDEDDKQAGEKTTYTLSELAEYGSGEEGKPILLGIFGRIYDVSAGAKFYGEDGSYHMFAGKDVTRALSTGCKEEECLVRSTEGLSKKQINEGKRWLSFFQLHDKYPFVGTLEEDSREDWLEELIESAMKEKGEKGPPIMPKLP